MARVELRDPIWWEGERREAGEVIEVPDNIAEANDHLIATTKPLTSAKKADKPKEDKDKN